MRQTILNYINDEYTTTEHKLISLRIALQHETNTNIIELIEDAIITLELQSNQDIKVVAKFEGTNSDDIKVKINKTFKLNLTNLRTYKAISKVNEVAEKFEEIVNNKFDGSTDSCTETITINGNKISSFEKLAEIIEEVK